MIDMAGVLTTYLRSQSALMTLVNDKVYCDELPEQTEAPFVLVRALSVTPAAPPARGYPTNTICRAGGSEHPPNTPRQQTNIFSDKHNIQSRMGRGHPILALYDQR